MRLPNSLARLNKVVTNPIQRLWAPHFAPFIMLEHVGRKSGKRYSIPVVAFVDGDKLSIVLTYGPKTDWVRNVQAAGRFDMVRKNKRYTVVGPRLVPSDSPDIVKAARIPARAFDYVLNGTIREGD
ncbi:nitroreductase family deazaflavin-dependent oxidoreductase [Gordonia crocea]|uniref:Peptidase n=1 Tax=Gordonia crocea TaxID=589162 RepID=A0A7I9UX56_9ACTN|nr:nitroreductase family deazaflavin-dependent oxidoreductase [Gordonia crocea]GED97380.1 hypothetical protein nbrc107697_14190 [Gordonia crocea]